MKIIKTFYRLLKTIGNHFPIKENESWPTRAGSFNCNTLWTFPFECVKRTRYSIHKCYFRPVIFSIVVFMICAPPHSLGSLYIFLLLYWILKLLDFGYRNWIIVTFITWGCYEAVHFSIFAQNQKLTSKKCKISIENRQKSTKLDLLASWFHLKFTVIYIKPTLLCFCISYNIFGLK